jgi:hypothetical protein
MITLAVIVGVWVPVFGLTYRFLTKTSEQDRKRLAGSRQAAEAAALKDVRLDNTERQLEDLEGLVRRLVDATEFDRQLKAGRRTDEEG